MTTTKDTDLSLREALRHLDDKSLRVLAAKYPDAVELQAEARQRGALPAFRLALEQAIQTLDHAPRKTGGLVAAMHLVQLGVEEVRKQFAGTPDEGLLDASGVWSAATPAATAPLLVSAALTGEAE